MKLNFTQNFFLKKQFLPIYSGNCTVLIVQSLAQGLFSRFWAGAHLEGEGMGGWGQPEGAGRGQGCGRRKKSPEPEECAASLASLSSGV